jgi:hypothetical protein
VPLGAFWFGGAAVFFGGGGRIFPPKNHLPQAGLLFVVKYNSVENPAVVSQKTWLVFSAWPPLPLYRTQLSALESLTAHV